MKDLMEFDLAYGEIIGVDEAGRGPLAGPVVAAAVFVLSPLNILGVNDSKRLSENKREEFFEKIINNCLVGIGIVEHDAIDSMNILNATLQSMRLAVERVTTKCRTVLIDGNIKIRDLSEEYVQKTLVKGDSKSLAIAAASIVAKVTRDRIMRELHQKFPLYNFLKNKGYGTSDHMEAIREHGPSEVHRRSFLKRILD